MSQKDMGDAAERFQLLNKRSDEFRRINQPVPCGMTDKVAVAAE
jgi:hypothetical protein